MDNSGLGNQTRNLCYMLKPDKIMIVNSAPFNGHEQHPEWYEGYNSITTEGWPNEIECANFMQGLTHVITAETVYNNHIYWLAKRNGTKVFVQPNWEFLDHLRQSLPLPNKWLMPSYWHLDDMRSTFRNVEYLPPPLFMDDFTAARDENMRRQGKKIFLHIVGKQASHDRNGTLDIAEALPYCKGDFKLVVRSQFDFEGKEKLLQDPRVEIDTNNIPIESELYRGFDAVIMPRRYAGLCLPMNEALASALPVIMPDIEPNNKILPGKWLVPASRTDTFFARAPIEVYTSNPVALAERIDSFANMSNYELTVEKIEAYGIASREFSSEVLFEKYKNILEI